MRVSRNSKTSKDIKKTKYFSVVGLWNVDKVEKLAKGKRRLEDGLWTTGQLKNQLNELKEKIADASVKAHEVFSMFTKN